MNTERLKKIAACAGLAIFMLTLFILASPFVQVRLFPPPARPDWTAEQKQAFLDSLNETNEPSFFRVVEKGTLDGASFTLLKFDGGDRVFVYKVQGFAPTMVTLPPPSATTLP